MGDTPHGVLGVDLNELRIISRQKLPDAASSIQSAEDLVHPWLNQIFTRTGPVGNYPDGPSANWCAVAEILDTALSDTHRNLTETAEAIDLFLTDILNTDEGAQDRMNQAQRELDGVNSP